MRPVITTTLLFFACFSLLSRSALAQPSGNLLHNSFHVQAGYGWTLGQWAQHRYAGVQQFGGGFGFRAELEHMPWGGVGIALGGGYMKLSTSEWESYARARGDGVSASAYLTHVDLVIKPYLTKTLPHIVALTVGITFVNKQGHESFGRFSYDYDFLQGWDIGCVGAIEYDKYFTDNWALTLRAGGMFVFSGISYGDGERLLLVTLPVTAGVSVSF